MGLDTIVGKILSGITRTEKYEGSKDDTPARTVEVKNPSLTSNSGAVISRNYQIPVYGPLEVPPDTKILIKPLLVLEKDGSEQAQFKESEYKVKLDMFKGYMKESGVTFGFLNIEDLFELRKTKNQVFCIPPVEYWPFMAVTLREILCPVLAEFGSNVIITSGYRPADYNKAVDGASNSRHIYFQALDIKAEKLKIRLAMADFLVDTLRQHGKRIKMGLGIYGTKRVPTKFHVDTCHRIRYWGRVGEFLR